VFGVSGKVRRPRPRSRAPRRPIIPGQFIHPRVSESERMAEKKAAGGVFAPARADVNPPLVDVEGGGWWKGSRTVEGLDGDLSLVHVGVLDDAVAAGAALAPVGMSTRVMVPQPEKMPRSSSTVVDQGMLPT
jgi:hypothetical protein